MKPVLFSMRALATLSIGTMLLLLALPALAQLESGNLNGTVKALTGEILPGVTVTLSGGGAPQIQVTDTHGRFRFPGLAPGSNYTVKADLQGLSPFESTGIVVNVGRNTEIEVTLSGAMTDVINVVADTLLDPRRFTPGSTVTNADLERIPSARDPWAVLQSVPGVLTDRINVGGNESGQQSQYVGPGSCGDQAVWAMDGVVITDMAALGSSPGYYDFDAFEEMNVTTGGSDASIATGGVVLNMVTKRGTNEWRGSGRYLQSSSGTQSNLSFKNSDLGQPGAWNNGHAQTAFNQGNRIDKIEDYGIELGGPIVRDRLWIWGSYAKPKIDLLTIDNFSDKTTLKDWNAKLNAQVTAANSATGFVWQSEKIKLGRNASPTRPQETTWDQDNFGPRPTTWKVEDTQIFSSNFFATGMYSKVNGGFELVPEGGDQTPFRDATLTWHNSFLLQQIERPQEQGKLDGSSYFNTGNLANELKYGAGYRSAESSSLFSWPGGGLQLTLSGDFPLLVLARDATPKVKIDYTNAYAQDTLALGNLTANIGVRWDRQGGKNEASSAAANTVAPELLPAVSYAGQDSGFTWSNFTPRLGATYALGAQHKTLLRFSYSRFADQLGTATAGALNPLGGLGYRYFYTTNNGSPNLTRGAIGPEVASPSGNVNPITFGILQSNAVNPNLGAPVTDEVLLGVEHALLPEFVVGLNLTYRKYHNNLEFQRLVFDADDPFAPELLGSVGRVGQRSDYVQHSQQVTAPDGHSYTVNYYELRPGVTTRNGFLLTNGEREQEFKGAALTFNKRLADRWMLRGNVSYQDWKWRIPDGANLDPTDTVAGGVVDGTEFLQGSGTTSGPKGSVFINSKWSYSLNGMYQVAPDRPWGFNVAANLTGRQGYPERYVDRINRATIADNGGSGIDVPVNSDTSAFRYPNLNVVDFRVEKEFTFSQFGLTLGVDMFNALNESYVLQRQTVIANNGLPVNNGDFVTEILSPRIFRLGARLSFR
ncbi:MAG TPA: TonB-dependent receptor [Thermoanaerobaculia bacterium]|nr:TonB-dependent receptor [Thermoanaerobaculia bacterium]